MNALDSAKLSKALGTTESKSPQEQVKPNLDGHAHGPTCTSSNSILYTDNAHVLITIPFCSIISSYMASVLFAQELTTINANITMDENAHSKLMGAVDMICYHVGKRIFNHADRFPGRNTNDTVNVFTQHLKSFLGWI